MDAYRAKVIADWLRALQGEATQGVFLADLKRVTGWAPHRPNLSKYVNARGIPAPETLALPTIWPQGAAMLLASAAGKRP